MMNYIDLLDDDLARRIISIEQNQLAVLLQLFWNFVLTGWVLGLLSVGKPTLGAVIMILAIWGPMALAGWASMIWHLQRVARQKQLRTELSPPPCPPPARKGRK
jgi:hypothetical protein